MYTWTKRIEVSVKQGNEEYLVEVLVYCHRELYGADTDGNRGESRNILDDFDILSVKDKITGQYIQDKSESLMCEVEYQLGFEDLSDNY